MASVGGLGSLLGPMLAVLGRFGPYVGGRGPLLGPMFAVLGPLGTYVGSLRPLLGPNCRSWVALGTYVGGLGPLLGPMLAVLAALGASEGGLGTGSWRKAAQSRKSGSNPSRSRVQKGSGPPKAPVRLPIFSVDILANPRRLPAPAPRPPKRVGPPEAP